MKKHSVGWWGSHPDEDNDDCYYGEDYDTLAEARAAYSGPIPGHDNSIQYVMLDSEDGHEVRKNPDYKPSKDDDASWRNEIAMQAGMGLGIEAYNDAMGYGCDPVEGDDGYYYGWEDD